MTELTARTRAGKAAMVALWILGALPALGVGGSGVAKFFPATHWQQYFVGWGYPAWFAVVTGTAEAVGAVLTFIPRYSFYGAVLLGGIMAGAAVTLQVHRNGPPGWSPSAPLIYLALFVVVATLRWRVRARRG